MSGYPVPAPSRDTAAFWEHAANRQLRAPRCNGCGRWVWQPRPLCPTCHSFDLQWEHLPNVGRVLSWTVPRPPLLPVFADNEPFAVLLVDLTDGVVMVGNLVDDDGALSGEDHIATLEIGAKVELRWHQRDDTSLPGWTTGNAQSSPRTAVHRTESNRGGGR